LGEQIFSRFESKIMFGKKNPPNDPNFPFKENEKEGGEGRSQLSGEWKVPMLGGPWKVPLFGGL
jgi:hypothetical protein